MKNWNADIDAVTRQFQATFGQLTTEQLNQKPSADTWSIAQNIDHLITINNTYVPVLESVRKGTYKTPFMGKIGFMVSFLGKMILGSVQPDRKRKIKTFPIWEPTTSTVPDGILDRFAHHQEELKQMIHDATDLIQKGTVISSPANKNIVYTVEKAFEIIITHEQRHFEQAKEMWDNLQKE